MATHVLIRKDIALNWTANNPHLRDGERGLESDTRKTKMGDGVNYWNDLPYEAAGTGSVTSVGVSVPSFLSVSGSPVTTTGTIAISLANQNANIVFAGPASGSPAAPTFRSLVSLDLASGGDSTKYLRGDMSWQLISGLSPTGDADTIAFFNASGVLSDNSSELTWRTSAKKLGVGYSNVESMGAYKVLIKAIHSQSLGGLSILGAGLSNTEDVMYLDAGGGNVLFQMKSNGRWGLGKDVGLGVDYTDVNIGWSNSGGQLGGTGNTRTAINGYVNGYGGIAVGNSSVGTSVTPTSYGIAMSYGAAVEGGAHGSVSNGMGTKTGLQNQVMVGTTYYGEMRNTLQDSVALGTGYPSSPFIASPIAKPTAYFLRDSGMILSTWRTMATTDFDRMAGNAIHGYSYTSRSSAITVTSVTNASGLAVFTFSAITDNIQIGDEAVIAGLSGYTSGTYYVNYYNGTQMYLSDTRAHAIAGTNSISYVATATGTITIHNRRPVNSYTDAAMLYMDDNATGNASWFGRTEAGMYGPLVIYETKTTTGDPSGYEGRMVYNSFDATFRMYIGGGWIDMLGGGGGGGTVTSIELDTSGVDGLLVNTLTSDIINSTGTFALSWGDIPAHRVLIGPTSGASTPPSWRSLVASDIPSLSATYYLASNPSGYITGNQTITLSGDISGSGTTAITTAIGAGKVTNTMLAGSIAYSKLVLTGAILNADLAGSIAYSKLSLTGAILNADLAGSIAYSKLSLTGAILNADLAGSIASSKLVGTDIATVGTITSGTWQGTVVGKAYGGFGADVSSISANLIYAGPAAGGAAAPTFRSLVAADIPSLSGVYQPLDSTLTALAAYNTNGIITQTAADTFTGRTITGTSNRITLSNGDGVAGNPTIDISSSYAGQASITTLGTIGTGVWNGTKIGLAYGGTNADLSATGGAGQYLKQNSSGANITVSAIAESEITFTDITTGNVTSTKHGYTPKSPADATMFLNGAATPGYAAVKDSDLALSDITTNNASTSNHGFLKKLDNNAYNFMNGAGNWKEPFNYSLRAYNLLGGAVVAEPIGISIANITSAGGLALTSGRVLFVAVYLPQAATITGITWYQITKGSYTANNNNKVGLYSYSGGTLTQVASCANDGTLWQTANSSTWGSKAFSSTYAAAAGIYFIALIYSRSAEVTGPVIGAPPPAAASSVFTMDFTNSAKINAQLAAQTDLPSPTQASSGLSVLSAAMPYVALY